MAHYEQSHQDLCCLQIQLFSSLVLKESMDWYRTLPVISQGLTDGRAVSLKASINLENSVLVSKYGFAGTIYK